MTAAEWDELRSLLDAVAEEVATPEQVARLEALVLAHPEAEAHYVQYMSLIADLSRGAASLPGPAVPWPRIATVAPSTAVRPRRRLWNRPWVVGLAGLAAGVLLAIWLWPRPIVINSAPRPDAVAERVDHTVAVLLRTHNADWEDTGMPTRPGSALPPGRLILKSGHAHLEFYSGATVILEGPAELALVSRAEAFCARGKLRATVPPQAQGFAVGSPALDLIDRGTEFGLSVADGKSAVHVFEGQVDVYDPEKGPPARALKVVRTGQGISRIGPGAVEPIGPDPASFPTAAHVAAQAVAATRARQDEWRRASEALHRDPSLLVHYTFEPDVTAPRTLRDRAGNGRSAHDGAIVGAIDGPGRWPGRAGLEFRQVSDRVRLTIPGEFEAFTLAAWVRPDALPNQNNALLMADGWEPGESHWQIGIDGTIILGVQTDPKGKGGQYHAPNIFTADRLGRWVHLAVVYDPDAGVVTHYVDGRPVASPAIQFDAVLRFGDGSLGNWNVAQHRNNHPVRNFTGGMDEFLMFSRALSAAELETVYARGRPPN